MKKNRELNQTKLNYNGQFKKKKKPKNQIDRYHPYLASRGGGDRSLAPRQMGKFSLAHPKIKSFNLILLTFD